MATQPIIVTIVTPDTGAEYNVALNVGLALAPNLQLTATASVKSVTCAAPVIPSNASVFNILTMTSWQQKHDPGTPGNATGTTTYPVAAPDGTANCRLYDFTLTAKGGEIYYLDATQNASAFRNFVMDYRVLSPDWSNIANLESDLNWVNNSGKPTAGHGDVTIIGQQLAGYAGYAQTTSYSNGSHWNSTNVVANPSKWAPNMWHEVQWYASIDTSGNVHYQGVSIDGAYFPITVNGLLSSFAPLGWAANILNAQIQFDGFSAGSVESKVYASKFNIYCW